MTQAQGCVLIPLCNHHPGHSNDVGTTKRLLRGVVPTQDRSALKTSSQTGCIRLGWQLAAERPAFRWSRADLWAWLDLNQRPHPYQRWMAERCAIQPLRWWCYSVSPTRMGRTAVRRRASGGTLLGLALVALLAIDGHQSAMDQVDRGCDRGQAS